MRIRVSLLAAAACALAASMPARAKQLSTELDLDHSATIGAVTLQPGRYRLVADEAGNQVKVFRDYRAVAQVKGQWITTPQKAKYSEVVSDGNVVQEATFAGKNRALKFTTKPQG